MYKLAALLLALPLLSHAQDNDQEQIFLNQKNEITSSKTDLKCIRNEESSSGYTVCYDCIDATKKARKQLNMELHVKPELKNQENSTFIKNETPEYGDYLIGEYKDGKPFNGFFKLIESDWLIYDFYKEGQLVEQVYNDKFHTLQQGQDTKLAFTTLDATNKFTNGVLTSGIQIMPVRMEHGAGEIITVIENSKPNAFMVALYAENFGECIKITRIDNSIFFKSLWNNAMKITFSPEGRKVEMFSKDGKLVNTLIYKHYKLSDLAKVDQKRFYVYFLKDKQIYIEQIIDENKLLVEEDRHREQQESSTVRKMANNFYSPVQLSSAVLERLVNDPYWGLGTFLGRHDFYEGKSSGIEYSQGITEGTYDAEFVGDLNSKETLTKIRNKSPEQIVEILKKM